MKLFIKMMRFVVLHRYTWYVFQSLHMNLIMTADWVYHCRETGLHVVSAPASSHLLPESHHRNCLCEAPLLSAEPPCLSIRKRNNQIKQKSFFYTYNLVDIMNMITFIIIYPNLLENLIVGHVLINNLLGYFNV